MAAKLRVHRRSQQGERLKYEVFRIGPDREHPWPTEDEVLAILKKQRRMCHCVWESLLYSIHQDRFANAASGRPSGCCAGRVTTKHSLCFAQQLPQPQPCRHKFQLGVGRKGIPLGWRVAYCGIQKGKADGGRASQLSDRPSRVADEKDMAADEGESTDWCWRAPICADPSTLGVDCPINPPLAALTFIG